jgi:ornithine cyclodeaminase/alanine dehydrogenase
MTARRTLLFNRSSFEALLNMQDYISAVEQAHRLHAEGKIIETNLVHADAPNGEYHIKTGGLIGDNAYYGLKANGGFFNNQRNYSLPNILGVIYLSDANNAYPLAIFESSLISKMRTAAATAVAAKYLAPKGPLRLAVIGYGNQAEAQIEALHCVTDIASISISGRDEEKARLFASNTADKYRIPVTYTSTEEACKQANTIITCTPSTSYLVQTAWVNKGTFIAAVGADSPGKNELEPSIFSKAKVVGDITSQIVKVGEAQHAIQQGIISRENIHGELGELISGKIEGRTSADEVTIYDSTGTAIQDIACAAYIYEKLKDNPEILGLDLFQ